MNTTLILFFFALLFLGAMVGLALALGRRREARLIFANIIPGAAQTHGSLTLSAENAFTARYLVAKAGSASNEADVCTATDKPLGMTDDTAAADELIGVKPFGVALSTQLGLCAVAIARGDEVYTAAAGKITNVPVPGCYHLGRCVTATSGADQPCEFAPLAVPVPFVYRGKITLGGGAATEAITITGLTAAMHVQVTIANNNANEDLNLLEATPSADTLTVRFQEDPGDGAVIDVTITTATTTADNGA